MKINIANPILLKISEADNLKDLIKLIVELVKAKTDISYIRTAMNKLLSMRKE
jgi:hypothetical protein